MTFQVETVSDHVEVMGWGLENVQLVELAPLQKFGNRAFKRDFKAATRAERGITSTVHGVYQQNANDRKIAAQGCVLDHDRKSMIPELGDPGLDAGKAVDDCLGHIR